MLKPTLFCFWTGSNDMSSDRLKALDSMSASELDVIFIDQDELCSWEIKNSPLHPAYKYLSPVHRGDYLRCYFMHHYGGAYSDIKVLKDSWLPSYNELLSGDFLVNGYSEVSPIETARGRGIIKDVWLALNFFRVIGCCAFICKPNTSFTNNWINTIHKILDKKYQLLVKNPPRDPRDFFLKKQVDGSRSSYPLRWTEICGEVFHPLCLRHNKKLIRTLPTPDFKKPYL